MAPPIVLIILAPAAFEKAVGVATLGQILENSPQRRIEWAPGQRIIDRPPIDLRRARDVVVGFGASLDLQTPSIFRLSTPRAASLCTCSTARRSLEFMM